MLVAAAGVGAVDVVGAGVEEGAGAAASLAAGSVLAGSAAELAPLERLSVA